MNDMVKKADSQSPAETRILTSGFEIPGESCSIDGPLGIGEEAMKCRVMSFVSAGPQHAHNRASGCKDPTGYQCFQVALCCGRHGYRKDLQQIGKRTNNIHGRVPFG